MVRDPYRYSDATLVIPPALLECLQCFDGQGTELDLREYLVRLTGDLRVERAQPALDRLTERGRLSR